jgi:hypothetical protein
MTEAEAVTYEYEHVPTGARAWVGWAGGTLDWDKPVEGNPDTADITIHKILAGKREFVNTIAGVEGR